MSNFELKPLQFCESGIALGIRRYEIEQIEDDLWEVHEVSLSSDPEYHFYINRLGKYKTKEEAIRACEQNEQKVLRSMYKKSKKTDFILNVEDFSNKTGWKNDLHKESGVTFGITVHLKNNPTIMSDESIEDLFPEIMDIDELYEEGEGFLVYCGDLTQEELCKSFNDLGFTTNIIS